MADRTVFRVLEEAAEVHGYAPALHQPYTENGKRKVRTVSWVEYRAAAEEIAAGAVKSAAHPIRTNPA
jgi:hypothetical protein